MSNFTFNLPSGETFKIQAPSGTTFEQAQAIFKQQVDSGGLVGFNVGDAVNPATQAAQGLSAAAPQLSQSLASAANLLPPGTDLSTINATLGVNGAAVSNQISAAMIGAAPALASFTTGASSQINGLISGSTSQISSGFGSMQSALPGAISTAQANLPGELATMQSTLPVAIGGLTGQAAQIGSLANNAIRSVSGLLSGTPLDGINAADFVKQGPALGDIGNLSKADVTGTLAQASKLVGQASTEMSNALGVGKFGFDANQLEKSGFLKPGTASEFINSGQGDLTSVLSSPLPWTGKDGVKSINDLLGNSKLQDKIQQGLMTSGLGDLNQLGIPVNKLSPEALSGVATLAAKDPSTFVNWANGGSSLTDETKSSMNSVIANSSFAIKMVSDKFDMAIKQETAPTAAADTVNMKTVIAAGKRIIGNDKVPDVSATAT